MKKISFTLILAMFYLTMVAQTSKIYFDGSWIYTQLNIQKNNINISCKALVDTGCSFCTIDSTYLVSNFNVKAKDFNNTDIMNYKWINHSIKIDSIFLCGNTFKNVFCIVIDLKKTFNKYAPDFIVGANLLSRRIWEFNMQKSELILCDKETKKGTVLRWKSHDNYKDISLGFIVFEGKIEGKKNRFVFDTGTKTCKIQEGICTGPCETVTKERANITQGYSVAQGTKYNNVNFSIGKNMYKSDFYTQDVYEDFGLLNISFLNGKSFVLNYTRKTMTILDN